MLYLVAKMCPRLISIQVSKPLGLSLSLTLLELMTQIKLFQVCRLENALSIEYIILSVSLLVRMQHDNILQ